MELFDINGVCLHTHTTYVSGTIKNDKLIKLGDTVATTYYKGGKYLPVPTIDKNKITHMTIWFCEISKD